MSGMKSQTVGAVNSTTNVGITLKRTVAKVALQTTIDPSFADKYLLPPNYNYTESQLTETLRKRKDTFRRYRDLSIFAFIGVYLLSVVDAYVDAELSNFDITPDLSMKVEPAIINSQMTGSSNRNVGVQCSFRF